MLAKLLDLTKKSPGDRSADDTRLSANQLDHKQTPWLESLPQTPSDNPEQDQDHRRRQGEAPLSEKSSADGGPVAAAPTGGGPVAAAPTLAQE